MTRKTFAAALIDGLYGSLAADPNITIIGRGMLGHGAHNSEGDRLQADFADRIIDPPTSEGAVTSMATGAAMAGLRIFYHFGTASFAYEAWNQIVNEAANIHYMSGGQFTAPVTFHMFHGVRGGGAPQHSHSPQAMYANCPGLEVVLPSSPRDVKGLIRTALKSDNPTLVINHTKLLGLEGEVPDGDFDIPFGVAEVKRPGGDITIVATSRMVQVALEAADALAKDDKIEAEVVDPRCAVPLDKATICASVAKTGRLVVVDEGTLMCSIASEIAAMVAEEAFSDLKAPIKRIGRAPSPVPFSPPLEEAVTPAAANIIDAVRAVLA